MGNGSVEQTAHGAQEWARVLSIIVHDLRSPTAVISGYARMLAEGRLPESDRVASLRRIERAAERVSTIGQQTSELAQWLVPRDAMSSQTLALSAVVAQAVARTTQPEGVSIDIDANAGDTLIAMLDRSGLVSALGMVVDAVKREMVDGEVRVVARAAGIPAACDILVGAPALLVSQASAGGPDDADPFSLAHGASNLSLILAVTIIRAHDGRMWSVGGARGIIGIRLLTAHTGH